MSYILAKMCLLHNQFFLVVQRYVGIVVPRIFLQSDKPRRLSLCLIFLTGCVDGAL